MSITDIKCSRTPQVELPELLSVCTVQVAFCMIVSANDPVDQPCCHEAKIDRILRSAFFVRNRAWQESVVKRKVFYNVYQVF
jgi:hypothetical protein